MTNLLESLTDTVTGAVEAARSLAEITTSRVVELDSNVHTVDHVVEKVMGLEAWVDPSDRVAKVNKDTTGQMIISKEQVIAEPVTPGVDIGAFRRREEANRLVNEAHAQPANFVAPEADVPRPQVVLEQPVESASQAEARQLVESALAGQADPADQLTNSLREMGYHDQITL